MFEILRSYVSNMKIEDMEKFAISKGIFLNNNELSFLYSFIKKNYEALYLNPDIDLSKYKNKFQDGNYEKIIEIFNEYKKKYAKYIT